VDWSEVLNAILIPALVGLGGLFVWYIKLKVPAELKTQQTELEAKLANQKDRREHSQSSENVAITILESIIRESIREQSKESQEMRDTLYRLGKQVDNMSQSVRVLAGVVSEKN
jgi:hypothetical protein